MSKEPNANSRPDAETTELASSMRANGTLDQAAVADTSGEVAAKRTPQAAATRILARRKLHRLPVETTVEDLVEFGRK